MGEGKGGKASRSDGTSVKSTTSSGASGGAQGEQCSEVPERAASPQTNGDKAAGTKSHEGKEEERGGEREREGETDGPAIDYSTLVSVHGPPREGDKIAFKVGTVYVHAWLTDSALHP